MPRQTTDSSKHTPRIPKRRHEKFDHQLTLCVVRNHGMAGAAIAASSGSSWEQQSADCCCPPSTSSLPLHSTLLPPRIAPPSLVTTSLCSPSLVHAIVPTQYEASVESRPGPRTRRCHCACVLANLLSRVVRLPDNIANTTVSDCRCGGFSSSVVAPLLFGGSPRTPATAPSSDASPLGRSLRSSAVPFVPSVSGVCDCCYSLLSRVYSSSARGLCPHRHSAVAGPRGC